MNGTRALRYLAPNLITTANLIFGMLSLAATARGDFVAGGWFIIYSVLFDRLDGFVARLVRGTSELGVQLDSFADFLNFGVAPAFLIYNSVGSSPALPFADGGGRVLLTIACVAWVLAATFRLARYNITTEETPAPDALKIFFGVPTTLAGGLLITWYLALYKYSAPGQTFPGLPETFGGVRLFGDALETPAGVWRYFPVVMLVGAYLMASSLRVPKLGLMRSKAATVFVFVNVLAGYVCGLARMYPEYMVWPPSLWLVTFLVWGQLSPAARRMRPPPIFPPVDPLPGQEPQRPEDDMLPEGTASHLDGDAADDGRAT